MHGEDGMLDIRLMPWKVLFKMVSPYCTDMPHYATHGSAAVDLRVAIANAVTLAPGESFTFPCGFAMDMTGTPGLYAMILPRSGLGCKGLVLGNTVGLIDNDYHGEIGVNLWNRHPKDRHTVEPGMRVAQMMFGYCEQVAFEKVREFPKASARGEGGFGSTGVA